MSGEELLQLGLAFSVDLEKKKQSFVAPFNWYPYGTMYNFAHLRDCFDKYPLETLTRTKHVADIGGADGDLAFFLASLGYRVDVIDNAPTNYNGLQGVKMLIDRLGMRDRVSLLERDIDEQFSLPAVEYDLVFLLGILYHLKNPYYVLEKLSYVSRNLLLSTRVMRYTPDGAAVSDRALAYLLNPTESNNDATNYWIFTDFALRRLVERCGWRLTWATTVGDKVSSNPAAPDRDERAFMLLRSARK